MPKLGDVLLNVVFEEDRTHSVKTTDHSIEGGLDIIDHVEKAPAKIKISGVCSGADVATRLAKLLAYQEKGTRISYVGRYYFRDLVIESINDTKSVETGGTSFKFDIQLKKVRVVSRKTVKKKKTQSKSNKGKQQPQKKGSKKRYHTVQRGESLGKISQKYYGSTRYIDKIYNANKSVIGSNKNALKPGQRLVIP